MNLNEFFVVGVPAMPTDSGACLSRTPLVRSSEGLVSVLKGMDKGGPILGHPVALRDFNEGVGNGTLVQTPDWPLKAENSVVLASVRFYQVLLALPDGDNSEGWHPSWTNQRGYWVAYEDTDRLVSWMHSVRKVALGYTAGLVERDQRVWAEECFEQVRYLLEVRAVADESTIKFYTLFARLLAKANQLAKLKIVRQQAVDDGVDIGLLDLEMPTSERTIFSSASLTRSVSAFCPF